MNKVFKKKIIFLLGIFFAFIILISPLTTKASTLLPGNISTCGELAVSGLYTLTADVSSGSSTCFTVSSDNVIINGGGHTISGTGSVAIDARPRTGGPGGALTVGSHGYTNLIVNLLNISGFTTGINLAGNADTTGSGTNNGYGGNGGDVAIYYSLVGSVVSDGGGSTSKQYGGLGGNIMFTTSDLNISSSTLSTIGGTGTVGRNTDGGLDLNYSGTLTKTGVFLSPLSFFNDNSTQYGIYAGGTWPMLAGNISTCGTLYGPGTFTLTQSISGIAGTCFTISTNDVTLNGAGYTLTSATTSNTSYAVNALSFSNFTLASTTVVNFSNTVTSSSSITVSGSSLNLSSQKFVSNDMVISGGTINFATTTFTANTLNINYTTSISGTSTATSSALSVLTINNLNYGSRVAGLFFDGTWISRSIIGYWSSIASSADGKRLIAANGGSGNPDYLYTSNDYGVTWTPNISSGIKYWFAVTSDVTGTKLVATVGYGGNGQIYTSSDAGVTWVAREISRNWNFVKSSADGTKLIASVSGGSLFTSVDSGVNWNQQSTVGTGNWTSIAINSSGTKLYATRFGAIYISTDSGVTWSTSVSAGTRNWNTMVSSADGTKLVAGVNSGYLYTSTDSGTTWSTSTSSGVAVWNSITSSADGTRLTAVAQSGYAFLSTDSGVTWTQQTLSGNRSWSSLNSSADGNRVYAGGSGANIYTSIYFAPTHSVDILLPQANDSVSIWSSNVSWGISKYCYYSYDNFISTSTANCSLNGSDISVPNSGNITLYVKGISNAGVTISKSVNFNNYTNQTIVINSPVLNASYDVSTWRPSVNYSISNASLTLCQYSYNNFVSTSTADCTKKGSDISPPPDGTSTLSIKTVDSNSNVNIGVVTFIYRSHWNEETTTGFKDWRSITSSYDGTKFYAVANSGYIYSSTDSGVTWTQQVSSGSRAWTSISSDTTGAKLVATVSSGLIYTSTTSGATWNPQFSFGSRIWSSITSSSDGTKLAAVVQNGYIYTSTDSGSTWATSTGALAMGSIYWSGIASDNSGSKLVATVGVAGGTTGNIYTSTDGGANWATTTAGVRSWTSVTSSADGTKLAATAYNGQIYTSSDSGATWSTRYSSGTYYAISSSADGTKLVAVAQSSYIYTSVDSGVSWIPRESSRYWRAVKISGDGRKAVAGIGQSDTGDLFSIDLSVSESYTNTYMSIVSPIVSSILTSFSWTPSINWGFNKTTCQYSYNNFVSSSTAICSNNGSDILAPLVDGANTLYVRAVDIFSNVSTASVAFTYYASGWAVRDSVRYWTSMASDFSGLKIAAVASSYGNSVLDYIYTSTDKGYTWVARTSAGKLYWTSIASSMDGTKLAAVAYTGRIFTSTDSGVTWTSQSNSGSRTWWSIASSADGSRLAAVVQNGYIYTSTDGGVTWATSTNAGSRGWNSITSDSSGLKLAALASASGATTYIYLSTDGGATWATSSDAGLKYFQSIASSADGKKLVAVVGYGSNGQIYTSTNSGSTWTARDSNRDWRTVSSSADGVKLVAGVSSGSLYISTDSGVTWTPQSSTGSKNWITVASSLDGNRLVAGVSNGQIYTYASTSPVLSVDLLLPQAGSSVSTWSPIVSWGTATTCYYSFNNFTSTSTANCALNGSDIVSPLTAGSVTLSLKGIDASSNVKINSTTFTYAPFYWCGTSDSNWSNVSNWYTSNSCLVNTGSIPGVTSGAFLVGSVSPIISSSTTTAPLFIDSTGLTGAANSVGIIFSNTAVNTSKIIGNATFNNTAYNTGMITGNAIFTTGASGTFTLSNSMIWGGTISGSIKGGDGVDITHLIFNNSSSNGTTIPSNFSAVFNNSASNNGIINGNATFNNTGLFTMGTVNGTSTLNALSQTLNGVNNVINLVKTIATSIRDTLYLVAGSVLNISGSTTITGYDANNLLTVMSTTPGAFASLGVNGSSTLNYLRLKDIKNTGALINLGTNTVYDDGGNSGFTFSGNANTYQRNGVTSAYLVNGPAPLFPGNVSSCGTIYFPGTYILSGNISSVAGTCFTILTNGVTIDGSGSHYTVTASGGNTNYAVIATSSIVNGGAGFNATIQNITFSGFAGGVNANGNNGTVGGNAGSITITNSTIGNINANAGAGGLGATTTVTTSTTGNISNSGTSGSIVLSGTNLNLSNNTYSASSTLSLTYSGSLTTTNTSLSALNSLINNGSNLGVYGGGGFPILPGLVSSCANIIFSGTYTLTGGITGDCNVLAAGVTLNGSGYTLNGNLTTGSYGSTLSNINISGLVSASGTTTINSSAHLNGGLISAGTVAGDNTGSVSSTTITVGGNVLSNSVAFTNDVINNGVINSGNYVTGKMTNNGTINGNFVMNASSTNTHAINGNVTLNDSSINWGTINGNATLNSTSINIGTVNGNAVLNASSKNNGIVTGTERLNAITSNTGTIAFSGTTTFAGTGTVGGNVYDSTGAVIINSWVFNASSTNTGALKGSAVFNNSSTNTGTITGNADVYSPVVRPIGGVISGTLIYHGYPRIYFNDMVAGAGIAGKWDDARNWWADASSTIPALVVPTAGDNVTIYGHVTNTTAAASVNSAIFQGSSSNGITIAIASTSSDASLFNASSTNTGTITGNATFYGPDSDTTGTVTGTVTRLYDSGIYVVVKDFTLNGIHWVVQGVNGAVIDLAGSIYNLTTNFQSFANSIFIWNPAWGPVTPNLVVTSPVNGVNIKWAPSISWGTSYLVQYQLDGGAWVRLNSSLNGADIPRPSAGSHVIRIMSVNSEWNLTEKVINFTYDNTQPVWTSCGTDLLDEATRPYYYLTGNVTGNCTATASTTIKGIDGSGNSYSISGNLNGNGSSSISIQDINILGSVSSFGDISVASSTLVGSIDITKSFIGDASSTIGNATVETDGTIYGGNFIGDLTNNGTIVSSTSTPTVVLGTTINNGIINGDFEFKSLTATNGAVSFEGTTTFAGTGHINGDAKDNEGNTITRWIFNDQSSNDGFTLGNSFFNDTSSNAGIVSGNGYFSGSSVNQGTVTGNENIYYNVATSSVGTVGGAITYHSYPNGVAFNNATGDGLWSNPSNWFTDTTFAIPLGRLPMTNEDVVLFASTALPSDITNNVYFAVGSTTLSGSSHKLTGNISGNGAYGGHNGYNFNLGNITVTGTTTSIGGDGVPGISDGGKGGKINIDTSSTGGVVVNGGDPLHNGGDAGEIFINNSYAVVDGTRVVAVGGASSGCGFGGNGGNISLINSSGYIYVTATGEDATSTCDVIPSAPTSRSSGQSAAVGVYTAPSNGSSAPQGTNNGGVNNGSRNSSGTLLPLFSLINSNIGSLKFGNLPKVNLGGIGDNLGVSSFVNPLSNLIKLKPLTKFDDLPKFGLLQNITNFLFNSMAKNLADVSKTVPSIKGELNQTGILNGYDLYSMKESPIDTPTLSQWKGGKTSQSVGLMFVSVDGVEKSTKLSIDIKGNLYQMVDVKPYSTVSVTTKNMDKSLKVTFNNKVVNFAKDKTGQVLLDVTAPRDAGTYTLKVGVSTLQLKVAKPPVAPSVAVSAGVAAKTDRTDTFPADASKKLSPIQKLWSWFLK